MTNTSINESTLDKLDRTTLALSEIHTLSNLLSDQAPLKWQTVLCIIEDIASKGLDE